MASGKSGWLTKEGGHYKSWKKRFMVIEGTNLAYYKKEVPKPRHRPPLALCGLRGRPY